MTFSETKVQISHRIIARASILLGNSEPIQVEPGKTDETQNLSAILQEFYLTAVHLVSLLPCFYTQLKKIELSKDENVPEDDPYKWIIPADFLAGISIDNDPFAFALFGDRLALRGNNAENTILDKPPVLRYVSSDARTYSDVFITMVAYKLAEFAAPAVRGEAAASLLHSTFREIQNYFGAHTSPNYQIMRVD